MRRYLIATASIGGDVDMVIPGTHRTCKMMKHSIEYSRHGRLPVEAPNTDDG